MSFSATRCARFASKVVVDKDEVCYNVKQATLPLRPRPRRGSCIRAAAGRVILCLPIPRPSKVKHHHALHSVRVPGRRPAAQHTLRAARFTALTHRQPRHRPRVLHALCLNVYYTTHRSTPGAPVAVAKPAPMTPEKRS
ncbi:hypothetical protein BST61_g8979 [Cercospora zeina]